MKLKLLPDTATKLTDEDRLYYNAIVIMVFVMLVVLFNVLFAPLIFLIASLYFINNSNKSLTVTEKIIMAFFVVPFTLYILIARIFGMTIGLSVAIPALFVGLLIVIYKRRGGDEV